MDILLFLAMILLLLTHYSWQFYGFNIERRKVRIKVLRLQKAGLRLQMKLSRHPLLSMALLHRALSLTLITIALTLARQIPLNMIPGSLCRR